MNKPLRQIIHAILRASLWLVSCLILILMIIQIGIACIFLWLGSTDGKSWLYKQVQTALAESSYSIVYQNIYYDDIHGVSVTGLNISDNTGLLASTDHINIGFSWLPLLSRQLRLSVSSDNFQVNHLPKSDTAKVPPTAQKFEIPNVFFHQINIDSLRINKLSLDKAVAGQAMVISPELTADIKLSDQIQARMNLKITQIDKTNISWLPQSLSLQTGFDPTTTIVTIKDLSIKAIGYNIDGQGRAGLKGNQPVDITVNIDADHLEYMFPDQSGNTKLRAVLSGTSNAPALKAEGKVVLDSLKQAGLGDIAFTMNMPNVRGTSQGAITIVSTYKDKPAKISADIIYANSQLKITDLLGAAPNLDVKGEVAVDTNTMLAAGSVQITADDLSGYADLAGVKLAGSGAVTLSLDHPQKVQAAKISATLKNLRYDEYAIKSLSGSARLNNIKNPWPSDMDMSVSGVDTASVSIAILTTTLKQRAEDANYAMTVSARGSAGQPFQISGQTNLNNIDKPHPNLTDINLTLKSAGNTMALMGRADQQDLDLKISTKSFALRGLPTTVPDEVKNFIISGTATLRGALANPTGNVNLNIKTRPENKGMPALNLAVLGTYNDKNFNLTANGSGKGITLLKGALALPVDFSLQPFRFEIPPTTIMNGNISVRGDVASLAQGFLPIGASAAGDIEAQAKIAGTIKIPDIQGHMSLANGRIRDEEAGVSLNAVKVAAQFTKSVMTLQQFIAKDNATGTITGQGKIGLGDSGVGEINFTLLKFQAMNNEMANVFLSGLLNLKVQGGHYTLGGSIDPEQTTITIPERLQNPIPKLNIVKPGKPASKAAQSLSLDIKIVADNRVFVRGWGLDAEFGGTIALSGNLDKPLMDGALSSVRGRYEEFGRRFTLDHATMRFQGAVPPSPYLDIKADLAASDIVASVLITGPSQKPVLSFSSTPAMSQDEVLSRILFGKNMSNISPFQAIQLEQSLQRFSGKGSSGIDPLGKLRSATGLDDLSVDSSESAGTTVGAGKYVTDKVYIGVQRGQSETSGAANIKVDVTPNIAMDSKLGQDAQGGAGVSWHWDY